MQNSLAGLQKQTNDERENLRVALIVDAKTTLTLMVSRPNCLKLILDVQRNLSHILDLATPSFAEVR